MKFKIKDDYCYKTDEMKLEAVKQDGYYIQYFIETATDEMKLEAVKEDGDSIKYFIETATDEMKLEALKQYGDSIRYFLETATDKMKEYLYENNKEVFNAYYKVVKEETLLDRIIKLERKLDEI